MKALRDEEDFEIPMTSLLDVVFLLLIFFLVATNFTKKELDHAVTLPESESGVKAADAVSRLVINIRQDETLVVNGSVSNEKDLRDTVRKFVETGPGRPAVIRADARVPYRTVMRVFGICRAEGVKRVDLPVMEPGAR